MHDEAANLSRRRFLRQSAQGLGGLSLAPLLAGGVSALGLAGCTAEASAPAYRYWRQKDKGGLGDLQYLAMCGTLAPSAHNTQPWKFHLGDNRIELYADKSRHLASADAQRRMMQISLGCALENMRVAAGRLGYRGHVDTQGADQRFVADGYSGTLRLERASARSHPWFDAIFARQTTRTEFAPTQPPALLRQVLAEQTADLPGIGLRWLTLGPQSEQLGTIVRGSVRDFLTDQRHRDGMRWFRITRDEWEGKRDGIAVFNSDAPFVAKKYVEWFSTPQDVLGQEFKQGEIDAVDRVTAATPLWGLIYADRTSPSARVRGGQMAERVYLGATAHGYAVQPLCYPTEVTARANELKALAGLGAAAEPLFLFRLGKSDHVGRSVRRELKDVII